LTCRSHHPAQEKDLFVKYWHQHRARSCVQRNITWSTVFRQHQFGKTLPRPLAHGIKVRIKSGRPIALSGVCRIHTTRGEWRTKSSVCQGATYRQPPRQRHVKLQNPYYNRATTTTDGEGEGGSQRGDVRRTKFGKQDEKTTVKGGANQKFRKFILQSPKENPRKL